MAVPSEDVKAIAEEVIVMALGLERNYAHDPTYAADKIKGAEPSAVKL